MSHPPLSVSWPQPGADHRDLVRAHDLGHIQEHSPGLIHWHPAGRRLIKRLQEDIGALHAAYGYEEVASPLIMHRSLWEQSGHWDKYQAHMFVAQGGDQDEGVYAIKPMSCPGHINIYQHRRRSFRELPMRLFEFGHVHRREPAGALSGWMRLRGFVQDDSHVFCAHSHIQQVVREWGEMVQQVYHAFGFSHWSWSLSLRPEHRSGSDAVWDQAEQALRAACVAMDVVVNEKPGEGAFYGPKLEAVLVDRLGRSWQCGVAQLDFVLPQRFDLSYQDSDGSAQVPVLVHHAVVGSLERWMSIVMEHHGALPDAYAPHVVAVLPISQDQAAAARALADQLQVQGVPAVVLEDGPLPGRLRQADERLIPHRWVLGRRELAEGSISVRVAHDPPQVVPQDQAVADLVARLDRGCVHARS